MVDITVLVPHEEGLAVLADVPGVSPVLYDPDRDLPDTTAQVFVAPFLSTPEAVSAGSGSGVALSDSEGDGDGGGVNGSVEPAGGTGRGTWRGPPVSAVAPIAPSPTRAAATPATIAIILRRSWRPRAIVSAKLRDATGVDPATSFIELLSLSSKLMSFPSHCCPPAAGGAL